MSLNHRELYRFPWNNADNIISWLEPTKKCNIYCEGCYSANNPTSHKTLEQIKSDLDVFAKYRNTHTVSIAGGDPLCHPQIVEVVKLVSERGYNPIVNTNGFAMTEPLMRELKAAGMKGLTFHIDSLQQREGWTGKTELELNELRLHFAKMAGRVGGLSCAFNLTVYEETLKYVPQLLEWAQKNIDIVQVMVFINFRAGLPETKFEYYAGSKKVSMKALVYGDDKGRRTDISSPEVVTEIRKRYPEFQPCGYLSGTEDASAMKWLMTLRFSGKDRVYGYSGAKFAEIAQVIPHLFTGKYQGYVSPCTMSWVQWMFLFALVDKGIRKALWNWLKAVAMNPFRIFSPVYLQSVMIIQPVDVMPDGKQSMCDGCPDMTVHNGRIVWSCRLEEKLKYGCFLDIVPAGGDRGGGKTAA